MPEEPLRNQQPKSPSPANSQASSLPAGWSNRGEEEGRSRRTIQASEVGRGRTATIGRIIGYGLLLYALLDYLYLLIPPQLSNPAWQFETMGQMVERVWAPLLGFWFIFYGAQFQVRKIEAFLLRFLSWMALLLGIFYFLMLPLGINNTIRLNDRTNTQIEAQLSQQVQQLQQQKEQLGQINNQQLQNLFAEFNRQNPSAEIQSPQQLQERILSELETNQQNLQTQANIARSNQRRVLLKNSVKWNIGALLSGFLFVIIWALTDWVRSLRGN